MVGGNGFLFKGHALASLILIRAGDADISVCLFHTIPCVLMLRFLKRSVRLEGRDVSAFSGGARRNDGALAAAGWVGGSSFYLWPPESIAVFGKRRRSYVDSFPVQVSGNFLHCETSFFHPIQLRDRVKTASFIGVIRFPPKAAAVGLSLANSCPIF